MTIPFKKSMKSLIVV